MSSTTHSNFGADTEGAKVAEAFASGVKGKTIIVTGANLNGLGFSAARALAAHSPAHLILTGRSLDRVQECVDAVAKDFPNVDCRPLKVDLSSQKSVRAAATELLGWQDVPTIDILINSAGVMGVQERTLSVDGIELHFATNHIGHWLFSCLIIPKLIKAAETNPKGATRIVNVSSGSPRVASMRWSDINFNTTNRDLPAAEKPDKTMLEAWGYADHDELAYVPLDGYNRSKVANVLFGIGANKRLFENHGIFTTAVHPGVILTDLGRNFPTKQMDAIDDMRNKGYFQFKSFDAGSSTALVAALDPKLAEKPGETVDDKENWGSFLEDCQISGEAHPLSVSSAEAERLWKLSEELVHESFSW